MQRYQETFLKGYAYQQQIFSFLLLNMDIDRIIEKIIPEASDD